MRENVEKLFSQNALRLMAEVYNMIKVAKPFSYNKNI